MTAMTGRSGIASGTHRREWRTAPRLALGGAFGAILLGTIYATGEWAHVVASLAGFATIITLIAAAVISWERVVLTAESAGLVERSRPGAEPSLDDCKVDAGRRSNALHPQTSETACS
jgi:hypothetical protein